MAGMDESGSGDRSTSRHRIIKRVAIWFSFNTLLGITLAFFIASGSPKSFGVVLIYGLLFSQIVASSAEISGYALAIRFRRLSPVKIYAIVLPGSLLGTVIGCSLCVLLIEYPLNALFHYRHYNGISEFLLGLYLPSFFLTLIIASAALIYEFKTNSIFSAEKDDDVKSVSGTSPFAPHPVAFSFRQQSDHVVVPYQDILYLSAHGMKTILHTVTQDYETGMLLKNAGQKLPESDFLRVHKSHIVNLNRIVRLQYFMGGSYLAFLNDTEETELPVGKKYASELKKRMGIGQNCH